MKKSRFSEEQIAHALRQVESGTTAVDVCRRLGVTEQTFYAESVIMLESESLNSGGLNNLNMRTVS